MIVKEANDQEFERARKIEGKDTLTNARNCSGIAENVLYECE